MTPEGSEEAAGWLLLDIVAQQVGDIPVSVADADWLTPWAVAARYGFTEGSLDRRAALASAVETLARAAPIAEG